MQLNIKKILLFIFVTMIAEIAFANANSHIQKADTTANPNLNEINKPDVEAEFSGGDNAWRLYLEKKLDPAAGVRCGSPVGEYVVIILFTIDTSGKVTNFKKITNHGYCMEDEVIRVLKKAPKWIPAQKDGKNVEIIRKQPITFYSRKPPFN
jgi:hypothetical protein